MSVTDPRHTPAGDLVVYEGPFTIADRDAVPDNGYRHELLEDARDVRRAAAATPAVADRLVRRGPRSDAR